MAYRFDNNQWGTRCVPLSHQLEVTEDIAKYAKEMRDAGSGLTVCVEQFSTMQYLSKAGLNTIELVGGVIHVCNLYDVVCFRHAPMHRTPFQDEAHRLLSERRKSVSGFKFVVHEEDALAHLLRLEHNLTPAQRLGGGVYAGP